MKNRLLLYISTVILIVLAVAANELSFYLSRIQGSNSIAFIWLALPLAVLIFVSWAFLVLRLYHQQEASISLKGTFVVVGLLTLITPLIPGIAIHLDLPYTLPYLQIAGAFLALMPFFKR
jgi:hypothetical protein